MAMTPPDMGMMAKPKMEAEQINEKMPTNININLEQFQNAVTNLSAESMQTLDQHLTPGVKQAIGELFGSEVAGVLKDIGPDEPTVNIPVSVIANAYPAENIEESIKIMGQELLTKKQNDIPSTPQGGLGGDPMMASPQTGDQMMDSPQTNVPPGPMPTGMA